MGVEFTPWDEFVKGFDWRQGEHVSIIGPTGAGKTNLARAILPIRDYGVFIATKPKDPAIKEFQREGMTVIPSWESRHDAMKRIILRPPFKSMSQMADQRDAVSDCLESIFVSGGWCVYLDELRYVSKDLGLDQMLKVLYLQGRSAKVSIVGATQRPMWVPREMFSEATHFFMWRMTDREDLKRLREISGAIEPSEIEKSLKALPSVRHTDVRYHDVLYVNARSGRIVHTRAPR